MWMFCFMCNREKGDSDGAADSRARAMFPEAGFFVVGPKLVHAYVKADIDAATAAVLSSNPMLLAGSARLTWVANEGDLRRVSLANQACNPGGCACPACKTGEPPSFSALMELLERMKKSRMPSDPLKAFLDAMTG